VKPGFRGLLEGGGGVGKGERSEEGASPQSVFPHLVKYSTVQYAPRGFVVGMYDGAILILNIAGVGSVSRTCEHCMK
jgi:hypothetical protein